MLNPSEAISPQRKTHSLIESFSSLLWAFPCQVNLSLHWSNDDSILTGTRTELISFNWTQMKYFSSQLQTSGNCFFIYLIEFDSKSHYCLHKFGVHVKHPRREVERVFLQRHHHDFMYWILSLLSLGDTSLNTIEHCLWLW